METTAKRRAEPTDDLFSILVNSEVDGQRMSDDEIVFETLLILIGGDETTRHTLSGGTEQLLRHSDQWERLVADADAGARRGGGDAALDLTGEEHGPHADAPTPNSTARRCARARRCCCCSSRRISTRSVFGDPENFRIDRNPNSHLAFGFGTHFCLGNQLARLELTTMLRKLLRAAAGSAAGRRFRPAAAAGELRQRAGGDAGGVHPVGAGAGIPR